MKIRKVRIGAVTYRVRGGAEIRDEDGGDLAGKADYFARRLDIDRAVDEVLQPMILWHEILHVLLHQTGHENEEGLVEALGYGVCQVIRDNPALVRATRRKGRARCR